MSAYREVYSNRNLTGSPLRPAKGTFPLLLFGLGLVLLVILAGSYHFWGDLGQSPFSKSSSFRGDAPQSYGTQILIIIGLLGAGCFMIATAISRFKKTRAGRSHLRFNKPLAHIEGFPTFISDTDTGRGPNQLLVGGKTFDLIDCSHSGGLNLAEYHWGESTPIRGVIRAWFIPSTSLLVRAEWRAFSPEEITQWTDAFIQKSRAWDPDIGQWIPAAREDPRVYEDCRKLVTTFKKLIEEDCQKLEGLKPSLFPGVSMRKRRKAESEYDLLINRIRFNRGTLIKGLKSLKTKIGKQK